jgi:Icc protein
MAGMRVLQLSDPHLLADPSGRCRGVEALAHLRHGWRQALSQLEGQRPDLLLISGDLCQDESYGGYVRLRDALASDPAMTQLPLALLPGNHDDATLLRAVFGRRAVIAPALVSLGPWQLLLLSSHRPGSVEGWIEPPQLAWLAAQLQGDGAAPQPAAGCPVLVALHHPPVAIGAGSGLDRLALQRPERLLAPLLASPRVRGVVFGHIHQHWQGQLERPSGGEPLPLWGCPSTLAPFEAVQPCPLGRPDWPGGRLLELRAGGEISTRLLRWPPLPDA